MKKFARLTLMMLAMLCLSGGNVVIADSKRETRNLVSDEINRPLIRGGIVYKAYCILCHGERGDGLGRAAKLYGAANMSIKQQSAKYYEKIVRGGGEAVGKSPNMPKWGEELSEEQIGDVVAYLGVVTESVGRGEVVFKTNCILCHGVRGDGKGRAAVLFNPPPANLTTSDKNDEYKRMIITFGGEAMGRSKVMPVWGEQLTKQEIDDVVNYIRTILVTK